MTVRGALRAAHGVKADEGKGRRGDELRAMGADWLSSWRDVIKPGHLGQDLMAGVTVAAVALPLNLALAVASGVPPSAGLIAGAIGGATAAMLGGAPLQVTGPAAALNVMVFAIAKDHGVVGVAAAAMLVGLIQLLLALSLAGKLARFVPESVLAGFTTGVGLKLLDNQLPELLGFDYKVIELAQMMHRPSWLHEVSWLAVVCGLSVAFLVTSTQRYKRFPAALVGVAVVTSLSVYLSWDIERVGAVPSNLPPPSLPGLASERWLTLAWQSLPLGLLAAAESLLSARAVDRMAPSMRQHNPNLELVGQGAANLASGLFGGMPVSGVVVRSGVNVQSGGRTRLSSLVHAVALLLSVLALSGSIAQIPLATLAGLLLVIAFRLVEVQTLVHLARTERLEALAFAVTAIGTVTGHLVTGLGLGLVIHAAHQLLGRGAHEKSRAREQQRRAGLRAVLSDARAAAKAPAGYEPGPSRQKWLSNIRERAQVAASAFVHQQATVIGRVVLGEQVHIAAGTSVRADEGAPFFIGDHSNVQDGVVMHALKDKHVMVGGERWAVYVGRGVSIAHDALVHGPCYIGDETFVGFKAVVHDAVVGPRCFIGIGAVVVGVEVPAGRYVPHGAIVDTADKVDALPRVSESHAEFNDDVVDVNRGLVAAYREQARGGGRARLPRALREAVREPSWEQPAWGDRF